MNLKLGQTFWTRDKNEYGSLGRSDFENKVVGIKDCSFLDGTGFIDFLVEQTRLNDYHISFEEKKERTQQKTYRLDKESNELTIWFEISWPGKVAEWQKPETSIHLTKPKNLRIGANK